MFSARLINQKDVNMLNICDSDILGKTLTRDKFTLKITENFGVITTHEDTFIDDSVGGDHIKALSFIAALRKSTNTPGPLIIDSPFGRIGGDNTISLLNELPTLGTQLIMFPLDTEIPPGGTAEQTIAAKIGQDYEITKITDIHSEIIETND